jgi:hypothetical protein
MKLTEQIKEEIKSFNDTLGGIDIDDAHEQTLDHLIDNDIVDLSDDEDGDMYEELSNLVYEFMQTL